MVLIGEEDLMRKLTVFLVLLLSIMLLVSAGCGGKKVTVRTEEGKVEYSEESGKVKVKTEEGEATYGQEDVSEEDLGVPIYPGAKLVKGGGGSVKTKTEEGEGEFMTAAFTTSDSIDEVSEWYRSKLSGKPKFMDLSSTMAGKKTGMFMFQEGTAAKTVVISAGEGEQEGATVISISSGATTP